jgi:hypothetical protein
MTVYNMNFHDDVFLSYVTRPYISVFLRRHFQTGPGAHPIIYSVSTEASFSEGRVVGA